MQKSPNPSRGRFILVAVLIAAIVASFVAGYFSRSIIGGGAGETVTVKVGALLPLTGDLASFGKRNQYALQLAEEDINRFAESIGSRFRFQVLVEDTGTDPQTARSKIEALAAQGVKAFVGPMSSGEVAQVKPFVDANKLVIISQSSTAASLALPGDNIFRNVPPDTYQGRALAKYVRFNGYTKAVVIYSNNAWGVGLFENFRSSFAALGGSVEGVAYDPSVREFTAEVARAADIAQRLGAGTAVVLISYEEGIPIIKLAAQNPVLSKLKWFGTDGLAKSAKLASEAGAETVALGGLPCTVYIPPSVPQQEEFIKRFRQRFGEDPDSYSMNSYDAAWLIALSTMLAGEYDGEKIAQALPLVASKYYGITGLNLLDENGDRIPEEFGVYQLFKSGSSYEWKLVAVYNVVTDTVKPTQG